MHYSRDMNKATVGGLSTLSLGAAYLTIEPLLTFLHTTFSTTLLP